MLVLFNSDKPIGGIFVLEKNSYPHLYKKWILVGSVIIKVSKNKLVNRSVLIDKYGKIRSFYDKIHMYDVVLSKKEKYFDCLSSLISTTKLAPLDLTSFWHRFVDLKRRCYFILGLLLKLQII